MLNRGGLENVGKGSTVYFVSHEVLLTKLTKSILKLRKIRERKVTSNALIWRAVKSLEIRVSEPGCF